MRKVLLIALASFSFTLTGCAAVVASPVTGTAWANVKAPLTATASPNKPARVGRGSVRSILGVFASGDASIQSAARNGGITEIHHVDFEARNFFGVIAEYTVVVYGN